MSILDKLMGKGGGTPVWQSDAGDHPVGLAWCVGGRSVAVARSGGVLELRDAASGQVTHAIEAHREGIITLSASVDGALVATAGMDGYARVWDAASGARVAELEGGAPWVEHARFAPRAAELAIGAGKRVRIFDARSGALLGDCGPHASTVAGLDWSSTGDRVCVARYGGVDVWNRDGSRERELEWKSSLVSIAWHPKDRYLAAGCQDNAVHYWKLVSGGDSMMGGYRAKPRAICWSQDGSFLASADGPTLVIWNYRGAGPEGTTPLQLEGGHEASISVLVAARSDQRIASGGRDGSVCVWRPQRSDQPTMRARLSGVIEGLAFSPTGDRVAACAAAGTVAVWKLG